MASKFFLFLTFFLLLSFVSCKDDNINPRNSISFFGDSDGYDLLLELDKPNLIGLIELTSIYQDEFIFHPDGRGGYTHYQGTSFGVTADIANEQRTEFVSLKPANIVVNAFQLQEYETGNYSVPSYLDIENYFGGGWYNEIIIDSNRYFDMLVDSVTFEDAIRITNVSLGDVINRRENFVVNFSGASNTSVIVFELLGINIRTIVDTNRLHTRRGAFNVQRNDGQAIVPASVMEEMKSGYYILSIMASEPKYITLSNGKEVCVLGTSKYRTTIKIED